MSNVFPGKDNTKDDATAQDNIKTRGIEVIEDDPDTVWGMWDSALADMDSRFLPLPAEDTGTSGRGARTAASSHDGLTQPAALEVETPEQQKARAMDVVEMHHPRVAHTIRTLWGHKECSVYIYKLLINGGDGMARARLGFRQHAANAMLVLAELHDSQFDAADGRSAPPKQHQTSPINFSKPASGNGLLKK